MTPVLKYNRINRTVKLSNNLNVYGYYHSERKILRELIQREVLFDVVGTERRMFRTYFKLKPIEPVEDVDFIYALSNQIEDAHINWRKILEE